MNKEKVHIRKMRIVTLLLLFIFGGILFNYTFFLHTHRTVCGKVIVHAHPFNKSAENNNPATQHKHHKIDLQVISSIDYFIFHLTTINIDYKPQIESEFLSKPCKKYDSKISLSSLSRGPPCIITLA